MNTENEKIYRKVYNGYIFAYPLVLSDLYRDIRVANAQGNLAAATHLTHMPIITLESKVQGGPNMDVHYSGATISLTEPYILEKPKTDRYMSIVVLDGYGTYYGMLGSCGIGGNERNIYALVRKGYQGQLPENAKKVEVPTEIINLLVRTQYFDSEESVLESDKLRKKIILRPLSEYEKNIVPEVIETSRGQGKLNYETINTFSTEELINKYNRLAETNPPIPEDADVANSFRNVNIGAGLVFSLDDFKNKELREKIEQIPVDYKKVLDTPQDIYEKRGTWLFNPMDTVKPGSDYKFRTWIQHYGPGAQPPEVACIPICSVDSTGKKLTGKHQYKMSFSKEMIPQHHPLGFWTISVYDKRWNLIPNKWNKYRLNGDRDLFMNKDGSVDIYFSKDEPEDAKNINWLPVGDDNFIVMLRVYVGEGSVVNGTWLPPVIERIPQ